MGSEPIRTAVITKGVPNIPTVILLSVANVGMTGRISTEMVSNWERLPVVIKKIELKQPPTGLSCWEDVIRWTCAKQAEAADTPEVHTNAIIQALKSYIGEIRRRETTPDERRMIFTTAPRYGGRKGWRRTVGCSWGSSSLLRG